MEQIDKNTIMCYNTKHRLNVLLISLGYQLTVFPLGRGIIMEFVCERGYDVEIDDDETVIFYKKLELFTIIYYLRPESLTLYNSDLQSIQILISAEERSKLTSPSVVIQFANAYITKNNPKWG